MTGLAPVAGWLLQRALSVPGWIWRTLGVATAVCEACLRSLWEGGYLLQVDNVYGPVRPSPTWSFYGPVLALEDGVSAVVGGAIEGRLYAVAALAVCVAGPMVLLRDRPWAVQCTAGLLGGLNPWVYDRIVEGQWGVAAAGGMLFLWLAGWESYLSSGRPWALVRVTLLGAAIVALNEGFIPIIGILLVGGAVAAPPWRSPAALRRAVAVLALTSLALLYGLVPFFLGSDLRSYTLLEHVGSAEFAAFQSTPDEHWGAIPRLLGLYGYWGERLGRFPPPDDGSAWWPLSTAILVALAIAGAVRSIRRRWLLIVGLIGVALSASTATSWGLSLVSSVAARVHLLGALREPQKFDALWLVAVTVLVAEALSPRVISRPAAQPRARGVVVFATAVAVMLPAGLGAIRGTPDVLEPVSYPTDWLVAADFLRSHVDPDSVVLVLPWHRYEVLGYADDRLVGNPGDVVFPGTLLVPNDIELPGELTELPTPHDIGALALRQDASCALADAIRATGIVWVVVEGGPGGAFDQARLTACAFGRLVGSPDTTAVLRNDAAAPGARRDAGPSAG